MASQSLHVVDLQEVLHIELHHRFYNSLQVISSLASRLTRGRMSADSTRWAATQLQDRIAVLADLHRLLSESHGDDLERSCQNLCEILASAYDREDLRLQLQLPDTSMSAATCRGLMLILAELVTNALKHAPVDLPLDLRVALSTCRLGYDLVVLSPGVEHGSGLATPPRVASQLASRFGGVLTVDTREGYRVHVAVPAGGSA